MALSFPGSPNVNQIHVDTASGNVYQWNGAVWINFNTQDPKNIKELDNISGSFDGSNITFALTSGSDPITPVSDAQVIISLGGVVQEAGTDYTTSGSNITFTTPPDAVLTFYGLVFGGKTDLSSVDDGSVHYYHLSSGGPVWDSSGNITISGIATIGTGSIVVNGATNRVAVGTASTIAFDSIVTTGIITAASFVGSGLNLTNLPPTGIGTTGSINTSGIITATSFHGIGLGLTNIGGLLEPLIYSPGIGATDIATSTGIILTYQKPITSNVGIIHLRENAIDGTIVESFDITTVGSSSTISISNSTLTITPDTTLGAGTTYFVEVPENVIEDSMGTSDSVGISSYSFETKDFWRTLWAWGDGGQGKTGQNDEVNRSSPTQIPGTQWSVHLKNSPTVIKTDGTLWAWGYNYYGNLGLNDAVDRSSPTQVPGTQWSSLSTGSRRIQIALKTDGTMFGWGDNSDGKLGLNDEVNRSSPTQIQGTQWKYHSGSESMGYATKTDGTLWFMGRGLYGSPGLNLGNTSFSSPTQIPGTEWDKPYASIGSYCGYFTKTDGTLWAVGQNDYGQLAQNTVIYHSSPVQIQGTWSHISGGAQGTIGVKSDGSLWAWGTGQSGSNGQGNTITYSSPVQIPGTQWTNNAIRDHYKAAAIKTDGSLWIWGYNQNGHLALNDNVDRSSPTQIQGTQWENICATTNSNGMMATKSN